MRRLISFILGLILCWNHSALACDFSEDVTKNQDGNYTYTKDCHEEVGVKVKRLELKEKQVKKLNEALDLKDLAITKSHERIDLWMDTTYKLEDRVNSIESIKERNKWIYFGLGILVTGAAVWGAGQLK